MSGMSGLVASRVVNLKNFKHFEDWVNRTYRETCDLKESFDRQHECCLKNDFDVFALEKNIEVLDPALEAISSNFLEIEKELEIMANELDEGIIHAKNLENNVEKNLNLNRRLTKRQKEYMKRKMDLVAGIYLNHEKFQKLAKDIARNFNKEIVQRNPIPIVFKIIDCHQKSMENLDKLINVLEALVNKTTAQINVVRNQITNSCCSGCH